MQSKIAEKSSDGAHKLAGMASAVAAILALLKLVFFGLSGSLIVAFSAWDSAGDSIISLINRVVIRYARKGDLLHPYGRGKAESIAALVQGAIIGGGSLVIIVTSIQKLVKFIFNNPESIVINWTIIIFFILCSLSSFGVAVFLRKGAKKYNSPALKADSVHYSVDVFSNLGAALAFLLIMMTDWQWFDPLFALIFSGQILFSGITLVKNSVQELMDKDIDDEIKKEAVAIIISRCNKVVDIHNFRGRRSGSKMFLDFHLTLPSLLSFEEVHAIVEDVESALNLRFNGDVIIHPDPDTVPIMDGEILYAKN